MARQVRLWPWLLFEILHTGGVRTSLLVDVVQKRQLPAATSTLEPVNYNFISRLVLAANREPIRILRIDHWRRVCKTFHGVRLNSEKVAPAPRDLRTSSGLGNAVRHRDRELRHVRDCVLVGL